tara:strand:- start:7 stop:303 length:297 start_codon:yes stop_codon:yes gene_type:complete
MEALMSDNFFTVEHHKYGIGTAILVKHRLKSKDDLFMCSFKGLKGSRTFYCRKHFDEGEEVWWYDENKPRKIQPQKSRQEELEEALKGFFFGGEPQNF